jgi:hypothetical protein
MDDKEKAKVYLQYKDNIIDVSELPAGEIIESRGRHIEKYPTFEERFMFDSVDNNVVEFNVTLRVRGRWKDVAYLYDMKKCAIVPYPED